jgi:hypothetical protein
MIEQVVNKWLDSVEGDLVKNYDKLGLRASGKWAKSLEQFSTIENDKIKVGILGENYTEQIENGRLPNKNQSEKAIRAWVGWAGSTFLKQWVKDKKLDLSPYAVAYKIATKGWKVPNRFNAGGLVSSVVTKERIAELNRSLILFQIEGFKSDILNTLR